MAVSDEDLSNLYFTTWVNTEVGFYEPEVDWYDGRYEQFTAFKMKHPIAMVVLRYWKEDGFKRRYNY
jgi:hypothetical protein